MAIPESRVGTWREMIDQAGFVSPGTASETPWSRGDPQPTHPSLITGFCVPLLFRVLPSYTGATEVQPSCVLTPTRLCPRPVGVTGVCRGTQSPIAGEGGGHPYGIRNTGDTPRPPPPSRRACSAAASTAVPLSSPGRPRGSQALPSGRSIRGQALLGQVGSQVPWPSGVHHVPWTTCLQLS